MTRDLFCRQLAESLDRVERLRGLERARMSREKRATLCERLKSKRERSELCELRCRWERLRRLKRRREPFWCAPITLEKELRAEGREVEREEPLLISRHPPLGAT